VAGEPCCPLTRVAPPPIICGSDVSHPLAGGIDGGSRRSGGDAWNAREERQRVKRGGKPAAASILIAATNAPNSHGRSHVDGAGVEASSIDAGIGSSGLDAAFFRAPFRRGVRTSAVARPRTTGAAGRYDHRSSCLHANENALV
jgi:hypothetical protein